MFLVKSLFNSFSIDEEVQHLQSEPSTTKIDCVYKTVSKMFNICEFSPEKVYSILQVAAQLQSMANVDFALYEYKGRHNKGLVTRLMDFAREMDIDTPKSKPATFILQTETPKGNYHALGLQMLHDGKMTRWALYDSHTGWAVYLPNNDKANEYINALTYHIQAALYVEQKTYTF